MIFTVIGDPAPQGSKRHVGNGVMIESSKKVKPWRQAVAVAAVQARAGTMPFDGPVIVDVTFWLKPPASASKKKLSLGPCRKPDIDKLLRSTFDALSTAGVWTDDARVVECGARKRYAPIAGHCGAEIMVWPQERGKTFPVEGA